MKITNSLRKWATENADVASGASDAKVSEACAAALVNGTLSAEKFAELSQEATEGGGALLSLMKRIADRLDGQPSSSTSTSAASEPTLKAAGKRPGEAADAGEPKPKSLFARAFGAGQGVEPGETPVVDVVKASDRYDTTRKAAVFPAQTMKGVRHPMAGQRVFEGGDRGRRFIDEPSELDKARCGAFIKWSVLSQMGGERGVPQAMRMTDHDRELVQDLISNEKWGGVLHGVGSENEGAIGVKEQRLTPYMQKALIDDAVSGGIEAAPIVFDDMVILTPMLFGEFFPRVNVVNLTRGRRIEGAAFGNVTISSGGADASSIPLFNTASFVSAFDTNIFVANGSVEIGLDFLTDTPVDVASIVTAQYGRVLLNWLDEQVCKGDGSTEPEGVLVASGTTTVNSTNGAGGPPTVGDYEGLLFGVAKKYKQGFPADRITYGANETTYQRARGIAVSGTDQRRIFGMTHEDYMLLGHPYGIGEFFTNAQITFTNWGRYRMYRRLGLTVKVTTEGKTLVRDNLMLLTARSRWGGQLEDGGACAVMPDAKA